MRSGGLTEISIREIYVDAPAIGAVSIPCIVCSVEQIEEFKPELEINSFRNAVVLVKVDIRFDEVWPAELLCLFISVLTKGRNREVALGNRPGQPSVIVGQLMVADHIRIRGGGFPVGVVVPASGLIGDGGIRCRASRLVAEGPRLAHREKAIEIIGGYWIAGLENARAANSPTARQVAHGPFSIIHAPQGIVEAEREAIGRIEDRWSVILLRIQPSGIGIVPSVIL